MNYYYFRVSGLVSTLENTCTPFCTHNAVKIAFKLRSISYGRVITHNYCQNRRTIAICLCLGCFDVAEQSDTTSCTHNAVKRAFKRRNILNGREITYSYRQNRRTIAIYVCLGLFRRWKSRALRPARIMQ